MDNNLNNNYNYDRQINNNNDRHNHNRHNNRHHQKHKNRRMPIMMLIDIIFMRLIIHNSLRITITHTI